MGLLVWEIGSSSGNSAGQDGNSLLLSCSPPPVCSRTKYKSLLLLPPLGATLTLTCLKAASLHGAEVLQTTRHTTLKVRLPVMPIREGFN